MDLQPMDRPDNKEMSGASNAASGGAVPFAREARSLEAVAVAAIGTMPVARRHPPKLYRIGEVVDYSGMSRQTIHNYTVMGLLHESGWSRGGHRLYDESVFERLDVITEMRRQNKSLYLIKEELKKFPEAGPANGPPTG